MRPFRNLFTLVFLLLMASCAYGQTVRVAAAADLRFAMNDLATQYEKKTGTKLEISYGSSGNFRTQIENGAPFDVFFSADAMYPQLLIKAGVADAESLVVYARGHLVIWALASQNPELYDQLRPKLVLGENISQAAQFVQSGSAQIGIIALSLTYAENMKSGDRWEIPAELYPPLLQAAVVVHSSTNKAAAKTLLDYIRSDEGRSILSKYGFTPPAPDK